PYISFHAFPTRRSSDLGASPCLRLKVSLLNCYILATSGSERASQSLVFRFRKPLSIMSDSSKSRLSKFSGAISQDLLSDRYKNLDRKSTRLNSSHVKIS